MQICNQGQRRVIEAGFSARLLGKIADVNPGVAHRWRIGAGIPDERQRLALELGLEIPQPLWLIPASDADQPAPDVAEPSAPDEPSAGAEPSADPFAHVPPALLGAYRELRDQALYGSPGNVFAAGEGQPLREAERPSPFDALRRLAATELWLVNRIYEGEPPLELVEARCDAIMPRAGDTFEGATEKQWREANPDYQPPSFEALTGRAPFDPWASRSVSLFGPLKCWTDGAPSQAVGDSYG
jgi:hypothetical protein